jgi:septum formation protein
MHGSIILASSSPFRRHLMQQAGLRFEAIAANIDERDIEKQLIKGKASAGDIALGLARTKALSVASTFPDSFVIGSDQIMSMDETIFHKCENLHVAKDQLGRMRGKTHRLSSAIAIARGSTIVWSYIATAEMTFRNFSDAFLDFYMEAAGEKVLLSVGAYQYEGLGQQLFEKVEGDYFTIIGLPMIPLLTSLRKLGVIMD